MDVDKYLQMIKLELEWATKHRSALTSSHHAYGVILEEMDEMWDEIKGDNLVDARKEAIQVAAMALRFLVDSEGWK